MKEENNELLLQQRFRTGESIAKVDGSGSILSERQKNIRVAHIS